MQHVGKDRRLRRSGGAEQENVAERSVGTRVNEIERTADIKRSFSLVDNKYSVKDLVSFVKVMTIEIHSAFCICMCKEKGESESEDC